MRISYNENSLREAVRTSKCYSEILRKLGLSPNGTGSRSSIKKYCAIWNIPLTHLLTVGEHNSLLYSKKEYRKIPLNEILIENSSYVNMTSLKNRLFKEDIKRNICELCGQLPIWQGKKISLILDHINGKHSDHRRENLRIVCPNCNATLDTFAGRNNKRGV